MSRSQIRFAAHGDAATVKEGGLVALGIHRLEYAWARAGTGFSEGVHVWAMQVHMARLNDSQPCTLCRVCIAAQLDVMHMPYCVAFH